MRKIVAACAAGAVVATGIAFAPAAQAKTVKACVKKSNGAVKIINKKNKKCKKGWVKTSWKTTGPTGPQGPVGPPGPNWTVKDKSGQTLGTFGGFFYGGPLSPYFWVTLDDGGAYLYRADGTLVNDNGALYFVNNGCTDAAILGNNTQLAPYLNAAGGAARAVFQVTNSPTVNAWRVAESTTSTVPVAANSLFQKNSTTGACAAAAHAGNFIVPLTPATAPKVASGALRITQ